MAMGMGGMGCGMKLILYGVLLYLILSTYTSVIRFFVQTYWWMFP